MKQKPMDPNHNGYPIPCSLAKRNGEQGVYSEGEAITDVAGDSRAEQELWTVARPREVAVPTGTCTAKRVAGGAMAIGLEVELSRAWDQWRSSAAWQKECARKVQRSLIRLMEAELFTSLSSNPRGGGPPPHPWASR